MAVRNYNHGQLVNWPSKNCIHHFDRSQVFQLKCLPLVMSLFSTFDYLHFSQYMLWFSSLFTVSGETRRACIPVMFPVLVSRSNSWCSTQHDDHPGDLRWYFYRRLYLIKHLLYTGNSLSIKKNEWISSDMDVQIVDILCPILLHHPIKMVVFFPQLSTKEWLNPQPITGNLLGQ